MRAQRQEENGKKLIEIPMNLIKEDTIFINTIGTGLFLAEHLKIQGIHINELDLSEVSFLKRHLNCEQHESYQLTIEGE